MRKTSSITGQSLEKIVQRAPAVGAKMWCLLAAALNLLKAKNQVLRPSGATRSTDAGQTLQGRRAPGSACCAKFCLQRRKMSECGPEISRISTFW